MPTIEFVGGEQFAKLAAKIRAAEGELPNELYRALEKSSKPLRRDAKSSALAHLPRKGGLNRVVAGSRMSTRRVANGIKIKANGIEQLKLTNSGKVRHPVYGHPGTWVTQSIPAAKDWWSRPMRNGAPKVRRELVKALGKIARRIA